MYYGWRNIKISNKNYKFETSAPVWNDEFGFPDGSYSASDIQDHFEYVLLKHMKNWLSILYP